MPVVQSIPVISLSADDVTIAKQLMDALQDIGFAYLTDHGVPTTTVDTLLQESRTFFALPVEVKATGARDANDVSLFGWTGSGAERLTPERPADRKEAFDFAPGEKPTWPAYSGVSSFQAALEELYEESAKVASNVLRLIGLGLQTGDIDTYVKAHGKMPLALAPSGNSSDVRVNYYPAAAPDEGVDTQTRANAQLRCGEHTDWGSITLLYQGQRGLQVKPRNSRDYIDVPPVPGTVVLNLGDLLQQWTEDRLSASLHRVLALDTAQQRYSIGFFAKPDADFLIRGPTGKYPPVTSRDWLALRLKDTY